MACNFLQTLKVPFRFIGQKTVSGFGPITAQASTGCRLAKRRRTNGRKSTCSLMSDCVFMSTTDYIAWELSNLTLAYRLREQCIKSYEKRSPLYYDQKKKFDKAKKEKAIHRKKLSARAMNGQTPAPSQPSGETRADFYIESQSLSTHLSKLGRFIGVNCDQTAPFIAKVRGITTAFPLYTLQ